MPAPVPRRVSHEGLEDAVGARLGGAGDNHMVRPGAAVLSVHRAVRLLAQQRPQRRRVLLLQREVEPHAGPLDGEVLLQAGQGVPQGLVLGAPLRVHSEVHGTQRPVQHPSRVGPPCGWVHALVHQDLDHVPVQRLILTLPLLVTHLQLTPLQNLGI